MFFNEIVGENIPNNNQKIVLEIVLIIGRIKSHWSSSYARAEAAILSTVYSEDIFETDKTYKLMSLLPSAFCTQT